MTFVTKAAIVMAIGATGVAGSVPWWGGDPQLPVDASTSAENAAVAAPPQPPADGARPPLAPPEVVQPDPGDAVAAPPAEPAAPPALELPAAGNYVVGRLTGLPPGNEARFEIAVTHGDGRLPVYGSPRLGMSSRAGTVRGVCEPDGRFAVLADHLVVDPLPQFFKITVSHPDYMTAYGQVRVRPATEAEEAAAKNPGLSFGGEDFDDEHVDVPPLPTDARWETAIAVHRSATVTGVMRTTTDGPFPGAQVAAWTPARDGAPPRLLGDPASTRDGTYRLKIERAAEFTLIAYSPRTGSAFIRVEGAGPAHEASPLILPPAKSLTGRVLNSQNQPTNYASVEAQLPPKAGGAGEAIYRAGSSTFVIRNDTVYRWIVSARSKGDGTFALHGMAPGRRLIRAVAGYAPEVVEGVATEVAVPGADTVVRLPSCHISLEIAGPGAEAGQVYVTFERYRVDATGSVVVISSQQRYLRQGTTWVSPMVSAGRWRLLVQHHKGYADALVDVGELRPGDHHRTSVTLQRK